MDVPQTESKTGHITDPSVKIGDAFWGLVGGGWKAMPFEPFRDDVEICYLYGSGDGGPSAALLKYAPGARVPHHRHVGYETIVILEGSQSDEAGIYRAGDVVANPPGTEHSVWSDEGCVVLIVWELPVEILGE